jgi:4-diphosphocytidyl-2-C-methyl-D-erythritol kinase
VIVYPNAKINLGLHILRKRDDGYHDIETAFYPVGLRDILELVPGDEPGITLTASGIPIGGGPDENLCARAYRLLQENHVLPPVKAHLHKLIPAGAGLGGGSSDAAFFIRAISELAGLGLSWGELHHYARRLGADCSFFIANRPSLASGKGDQLETLNFTLRGFYVLIVFPGIPVSTRDAYAAAVPSVPARALEEIVLHAPPESWKDILVNDFEKTVFMRHPQIEALKHSLYDHGAVYASMSGSGSAVYGIFREAAGTDWLPRGMVSWSGPL